jgi:hypothetical protein
VPQTIRSIGLIPSGRAGRPKRKAPSIELACVIFFLQSRRIQFNEALQFSEPRNSHIDDLSGLQGSKANRPLGRIGIAFQDLRALPYSQFAQSIRSALSAYKIRYPSPRSWKAAHVSLFERLPDTLPNLLFVVTHY